ncbi:hypothetical protein H8E88_07450 [candidate division KSB1 bacterium]|nr:hypothetical protein [candidate division KSB1 bacterium]
MKTVKRIVLSLVYVSILFSCAKKEQNYYTVETVDGVEFVHNHKPLWEDVKRIELKLHLTIGGIDATDEDYIFSYLRDADIDENGNYYLVANDCIRKYDAQGNYLKTIGRKGQGPGEFNQPTDITFDKAGHLIVYEIRSRRIQRIPPEQIHENSIRINYDIRRIHEIKMLNSGHLVISTYNFDTSTANDSNSHRILITDNNFNIKDSFLMYRHFNKGIHWKKGVGVAFSILNNFSIGTDSEDNIFAAEKYENKIEKYSVKGRLLRRFDRDLPYEIKTYVGKSKNSLWFTHSTLRLETDHKDRIWIQSYSEAHSDDEIKRYLKRKNRRDRLRSLNRRFEIYDNKGYLLSFMDPFKDKDMAMLKIVDDKMLLRDEDRVTLYVYKIVAK